MPVDTSFYNQQPQSVIPGGLPGAVGLANAFTQNRMLNTENQILQNQFQGNMALGNIYQQSLNPDGTVNTAALNRNIAAGGPAVGYVAPQAYQNSAALAGTNLANQGAQVGQSQARMNDFYNSLAALPPDQRTRAGAISLAAQYVHDGRLLATDMPGIIGEMPTDDTAIPKFIAGKQASTLAPSDQAAQTVTGVSPTTGQQTFGTKGQFVREAAPSSASNGESGGITTTLPAGAADSFAANSAAYNQDYQKSAATLSNVRNLTTAIPLLETLGSSAAGPGSQSLAQLQSFLESHGIIKPGQTGVDVRAEAQKYLSRYVGVNPAAGRSDMAQDLTAHSSPSLDTPLAATLALAKSNVGFDRMDAAAPLAYAQAHPNASANFAPDYNKFKADFVKNNDPRAYAFDLMTPAERQGVVTSLGKPGSAAYERFRNSLQTAVGAGLVTPPPQAQQ